MSGQIVGYVRVSAADQNPQRQIESLWERHKVFTDKIGGKSRAKRQTLAELLEYLRALPGEVIPEPLEICALVPTDFTITLEQDYRRGRHRGLSE